MDRQGFDPRYDPEFQRGFDPALHDNRAANAQTHERIESTEERLVVRPAPIPPFPGGASSATAGAGPRGAGPQGAGLQGAGPGAHDEAATHEFGRGYNQRGERAGFAVSPWRNPYLIGLTVLGLVLLGAGYGAFRWSVEQVYQTQYGFMGAEGDEAQEAFLAAQVAWGISPLLALAGVLTLVGVIFFIALRWSPRASPADDTGDAAGGTANGAAFDDSAFAERVD